MTVDFKVLDSKVYSFFVNDELCEIHLTRKGEKMFYEFQINKDADTPRNRARKKMEKKYWGQTLLFFGGMFLLLIGFLLGMNYYSSKNIEDNLDADEMANECKNLGKNEQKILENSYLICKSKNIEQRMKLVL